MKHTILAILAILSIGFTVQAQTDCYNEGKAKIAKDNMDEGDDGLTCANAAKFYAKLCLYKTEPLTVEQGNTLKKELQVIKKAYNDYGVYCKDIGRIDDIIPDTPTITLADEKETTTEDIILEAVTNTLGGNNNSSGGSSGNCNTAALNKFGNRSFSSSGAESAATRYEGYRCHCINGTAQRQFDGSKFSVSQLKNLRQNYYNIKSSGDPGLSPLPSKCADSPSEEGIGQNPQNRSIYENDSYANQTFIFNNDLQEKFVKKYSPNSYQLASYAKGVAEQGKNIAKNLSIRLNNISELIKTSDPQELLDDYNSKMSNIQNLKQNYEYKALEYGLQRGSSLGKQINAKQYDAVLINAIGFINASAELSKADKELKEKEEKLKQERERRMNDLLKEALKRNEDMMRSYFERLAYAENSKNESYYLNMLAYLDCQRNYMGNNFSTSSSQWLNNASCSKPKKEVSHTIENTFVNKEVLYKQLAEKKANGFMTLYSKIPKYAYLYIEPFEQAVTSFLASAAQLNPTAENYMMLGIIQKQKSALLGLTSMLTAKEIEPDNFTREYEDELNIVKQEAISELKSAVVNNNIPYIKGFMDSGLDKYIKIENNDILLYSLENDLPDIMQLVLNKRNENLSDELKNIKLKESVMLSIVFEANKCLQRFINLGMSMDFQLDNKKPIDIAVDNNSISSFILLVEHLDNKKEILDNYKNKPIYTLYNSKYHPNNAVHSLSSLSLNNQILTVFKLLENSIDDNTYLDVIIKSEISKKIINQNSKLQTSTRKVFVNELFKSSPQSKASALIEAGFFNLQIIPTLNKFVDNQFEIENTNFLDYNLAEIAFYFDNYELFAKLDKQFDLSQITTHSGKSLLEQLIYPMEHSSKDHNVKDDLNSLFGASDSKRDSKQINSTIVSRDEFLSKDFDVMREVKGKKAILIILEQLLNKCNPSSDKSLTAFIDSKLTNSETPTSSNSINCSVEITRLFQKYSISINSKISKTNGTLLHWAIDRTIELGSSHTQFALNQNLESVFKLEIDNNLEDNNGYSAEKYMKKQNKKLRLIYNEKENLEKWFKQYY